MDVRPITRCSLKQTSKQRTTETCYSMDVRPTIRYSETDKQAKNQRDVLQHGPWDIHPIKRYSLEQTGKQSNTERCYSTQ